MTLYIGDTRITAAYIGDTQITKMYLGAEEVFNTDTANTDEWFQYAVWVVNSWDADFLPDYPTSNTEVYIDGDPISNSTPTVASGQNVMWCDGNSDGIAALGTDVSASIANDDDFTWEAWIYVTDKSHNSTIIGKRDEANAEEGVFLVRRDSNGGQIVFYAFNSGSTVISVVGDESLSSNEWHHAAIVRRSGTYYMYVDGVQQTSTDSGATPSSNGSNIYFGRNRYDSSRYFEGYIGPLRVVQGYAMYDGNFTPDTTFDIPYAVDWTWINDVSEEGFFLNDGAILHIQNSDGRRAVTWDDIPDSANVEVLCQIQKVSAPERMGVIARQSGSSGNENGYVLQARTSGSNYELTEYNSGNFTNLHEGTFSSDDTFKSSNRSRHWIRLRAQGTQLQGKVWFDANEEPNTWMFDVTDASLTSGRVGFFSFDGDGFSKYIDYFSVGLNGEAAPGPSEDLGADQYRCDFSNANTINSWTQRWASSSVTMTYETTGSNVYKNGWSGAWNRLHVAYDPELQLNNNANERIGALYYEPQILYDTEVKAKVKSDSTTFNQATVVIRASGDIGSENAYMAELYNGDSFRVRSAIGGTFTTFDTIAFPWSANTYYWIHFQAIGTHLKAKVWEDGESEPDWMSEVDLFNANSDIELIESGYVGLSRHTLGTIELSDLYVNGQHEANTIIFNNANLINGDAEFGNTDPWIIETGDPVVRSSNPNPYEGSYYFMGGTTSTASMSQIVDLSPEEIAAASNNSLYVNCIWHQSSFSDSDEATVNFEFLDGIANSTGVSTNMPLWAAPENIWTKRNTNYVKAPSTSEKIKVTISWDKNAGGNSDGYVDKIEVKTARI